MRGRYSIIGLNPDIIWRASGDNAEIDRDALSGRGHFVRDPRPALTSLRALLDESRIELPDEIRRRWPRGIRLHGLRHHSPDRAAA